jgi:hypothetical protein
MQSFDPPGGLFKQAQFSTFRPRIRLNSSVLSVTIVAPVAWRQEVVTTDWLSGRFQLRADSAVFGIGGNLRPLRHQVAVTPLGAANGKQLQIPSRS